MNFLSNKLFFGFLQSILLNGTGPNQVLPENLSEYPRINCSEINYQNTFVTHNISKHYSDRQLYGSMNIEDDVLEDLDYG
jgi:hypothetical protein